MNPIMALLAAHAAGAQGAPAPMPSEAPDNDNPAPLISRMIQLGVQATQSIKDPIERAAMAKIVAQLHQFEANEQKEHDAAMGAGPAVKLVRRVQG